MGKIPLPIILRAVLCAMGALYWGACINPLDLEAFTKDEDVQEIIERGAGTVAITPDSATGLSAGNQKITGLESGKYYMVEEWAGSSFIGVRFVTANGELSANLADIGTVSGGEITGLANNNNYRVTAAKPVGSEDGDPEEVSYRALSSPDIKYAPITDGAITLPAGSNGYPAGYTFTPPLAYPPPPLQIVEISITPPGPGASARPLANGDIMVLMERGTEIDYVFSWYESERLSRFYVLKVAEDAKAVTLSPGSDTGLKAGNQKITGLESGKYYMVEEWDENGDSAGVQFVRANGERSERLVDIGMVSGGEITGLANRNSYRVRAAEPLSGDVPYNALSSTGAMKTAPITDGAIYLPGPGDEDYLVYVFTPPLDDPSDPHLYTIVEIPVTPAGPAAPARPLANGSIITYISRETETDYVFYYGDESESPAKLYVLRVAEDSDSGHPGEPGLKVTVSWTGDNPPVVTPSSISYSQTDTTGSITFTVSGTGYTGHTWYVDGDQAGTDTTFSLNKSDIKYKIVGEYIITVVATKDGKPYSVSIVVTVTS